MNMKLRPDRPETEGWHSVIFWPASCARVCLQGFAEGYAGAFRSISACEPTDERGNW